MKQRLRYAPTAVFLAFIMVLTTLFFVLPKEAYSENEKKQLATLPDVSFDALLNGTLTEGYEEYLSHHFPFRETFVGLQSYYELFTGRGGVSEVYFGADGFLIAAESTAASEETVRTNVKNYAAFADAMGLKATLLVVPQTGYALDGQLPSNHLPYHDDRFFSAAEEECGSMTLLDVRDALCGQTDCYYKTDHHLTMDGAEVLYKAYAAAQGLVPFADYTVESFDGFYGTSYSKSGYWASAPDTIETFKSTQNDNVTVMISSNGIDTPVRYDSLFFEEHLQRMDKYPLYLNGNQGLVTIHNPDAPEGKLLVVKDSFAHSVMTLLCQHYREIVMVDLRYYSDSADTTIKELVEKHALSEVLFLYGADSLSTDSSASFKLFYDLEDALPD
ncbi:MAG: hypothetical protein IJB27_06795 [Clostridia bacterium]|nr:hypothetical protein [Clostridia bacterium]